MTVSGRLEALEHMLGNRPDDSRLRFGLALEYLSADRIEDGVQELITYLEAGTDEGNGWGRLGSALGELGQRDRALEAYRTGIEVATRHGHPTMVEEFKGIMEEMSS